MSQKDIASIAEMMNFLDQEKQQYFQNCDDNQKKHDQIKKDSINEFDVEIVDPNDIGFNIEDQISMEDEFYNKQLDADKEYDSWNTVIDPSEFGFDQQEQYKKDMERPLYTGDDIFSYRDDIQIPDGFTSNDFVDSFTYENPNVDVEVLSENEGPVMTFKFTGKAKILREAFAKMNGYESYLDLSKNSIEDKNWLDRNMASVSDGDTLTEADEREFLAHAFDPFGYKDSTANLAAQDTVEMSIVGQMQKKMDQLEKEIKALKTKHSRNKKKSLNEDKDNNLDPFMDVDPSSPENYVSEIPKDEEQEYGGNDGKTGLDGKTAIDRSSEILLIAQAYDIKPQDKFFPNLLDKYYKIITNGDKDAIERYKSIYTKFEAKVKEQGLGTKQSKQTMKQDIETANKILAEILRDVAAQEPEQVKIFKKLDESLKKLSKSDIDKFYNKIKDKGIQPELILTIPETVTNKEYDDKNVEIIHDNALKLMSLLGIIKNEITFEPIKTILNDVQNTKKLIYELNNDNLYEIYVRLYFLNIWKLKMSSILLAILQVEYAQVDQNISTLMKGSFDEMNVPKYIYGSYVYEMVARERDTSYIPVMIIDGFYEDDDTSQRSDNKGKQKINADDILNRSEINLDGMDTEEKINFFIDQKKAHTGIIQNLILDNNDIIEEIKELSEEIKELSEEIKNLSTKTDEKSKLLLEKSKKILETSKILLENKKKKLAENKQEIAKLKEQIKFADSMIKYIMDNDDNNEIKSFMYNYGQQRDSRGVSVADKQQASLDRDSSEYKNSGDFSDTEKITYSADRQSRQLANGIQQHRVAPIVITKDDINKLVSGEDIVFDTEILSLLDAKRSKLSKKEDVELHLDDLKEYPGAYTRFKAIRQLVKLYFDRLNLLYANFIKNNTDITSIPPAVFVANDVTAELEKANAGTLTKEDFAHYEPMLDELRKLYRETINKDLGIGSTDVLNDDEIDGILKVIYDDEFSNVITTVDKLLNEMDALIADKTTFNQDKNKYSERLFDKILELQEFFNKGNNSKIYDQYISYIDFVVSLKNTYDSFLQSMSVIKDLKHSNGFTILSKYRSNMIANANATIKASSISGNPVAKLFTKIFDELGINDNNIGVTTADIDGGTTKGLTDKNQLNVANTLRSKNSARRRQLGSAGLNGEAKSGGTLGYINVAIKGLDDELHQYVLMGEELNELTDETDVINIAKLELFTQQLMNDGGRKNSRFIRVDQYKVPPRKMQQKIIEYVLFLISKKPDNFQDKFIDKFKDEYNRRNKNGNENDLGKMMNEIAMFFKDFSPISNIEQINGSGKKIKKAK